MTIQARVQELLARTDLSRAEIADKVGTTQSYVRVCEQRLAGNNASARWREKNRDRYNENQRNRHRDRYANDPEWRARLLANHKRWRDQRDAKIHTG